VWSYPKLTLYLFAIIFSYFLFKVPAVSLFVSSLASLDYFSIFIGGLLYSAGFTAPFATGFFLSFSAMHNVYMVALFGGAGALLADLGIFSFIRLSFMGEFKLLEHSSFIRHLSKSINRVLNKRHRNFLVYLLAFVIIASPLPDEIGVALLAGFTKLHPYVFMFMSFVANSLGILVLLSL